MVLEAVRSVLAQDAGDLEVIVVDDGSTDGTPEALARMPSVRYVVQERRGVAAARNAGVRRARGDWIAFLDSDDLWLPRKLTAQFALHQRCPEILVSQTEEIWIRNGVRVNPRAYHRKPAGDIFLPSLERCLVSPSAVMLRRDLFESVGGFDERLMVCEDYDLWLRLACRVPFALLAEPLVIKRGGHRDQLSRSTWGLDRFRVVALAKLLATGAVVGERRAAVVETLRKKCMILANGARRRGKTEEAEKYLTVARAVACEEAARALAAEILEPERNVRREDSIVRARQEVR